MREILFRGRLLDENNFHYVDWCYGSLVYSPSEDLYYIVEHCDEECQFPVDRETIGQYTGFEDKNGTKIFEGDIVKCKVDADLIVLVEWSEVMAAFVIRQPKEAIRYCDLCFARNIEVIGNIHDNPELLEVKDDGLI